jgi:hypothetical protein
MPSFIFGFGDSEPSGTAPQNLPPPRHTIHHPLRIVDTNYFYTSVQSSFVMHASLKFHMGKEYNPSDENLQTRPDLGTYC